MQDLSPPSSVRLLSSILAAWGMEDHGWRLLEDLQPAELKVSAKDASKSASEVET